jgi:hypothetical protein
MATVSINGTSFDGTPNGSGNQSAWQPTGYEPSEIKVGVTLPAADGTRNRVERGTNKGKWVIKWEKTNAATMLALRTIQRLNTTFTFVDTEGVSHTVQTEDDPFERGFALVSRSNVQYWNVTLTLYEK